MLLATLVPTVVSGAYLAKALNVQELIGGNNYYLRDIVGKLIQNRNIIKNNPKLERSQRIFLISLCPLILLISLKSLFHFPGGFLD